MIDHIFTKSLTKEDLTHGTSVRRDRINFVKYHLRRAMYFPFQLLICLVYMPFIVVGFAAMNADSLAFEYTYMTADNPRVNQYGPTMMRMKKHCWLVRFVCPWL